MTTLILPVAGRSSRFPGMRPKWLLTLPSGRLMIEEAVQKMPLSSFTRVIVTCLKEHLDTYVNEDILRTNLIASISPKIELCILEKQTKCHAETVYKTIKQMNVDGSIYLKDCDNIFSCEPVQNNSVGIVSLNDVGLVDAKNKSYVQVDSLGYVTNIIEKNVISSDFCCGGYSFKKAEEFKAAYEAIVQIAQENSGEIYISHIIYHMLLNGSTFDTHTATQYVDWGTLREYRHIQKNGSTIFCDIDGVLVENSSKFSTNPWRIQPIRENVDALKNFQQRHNCTIVVTTSRPQSVRSELEDFFRKEGIKIQNYVMDLPHTKRILINDFAVTNPYPSSIAINIQRDSKSLKGYLEHLSS